jgi:hypothetical protein
MHRRSAVRWTDRWYLEYVPRLSADELAEPIEFAFTDGAQGRMSREEMLAHVITHGGYHRGDVGLFDIQTLAKRLRSVVECSETLKLEAAALLEAADPRRD